MIALRGGIAALKEYEGFSRYHATFKAIFHHSGYVCSHTDTLQRRGGRALPAQILRALYLSQSRNDLQLKGLRLSDGSSLRLCEVTSKLS